MIVDRNKDFAKMIESIFTKNHTMINEVKKQVIIGGKKRADKCSFRETDKEYYTKLFKHTFIIEETMFVDKKLNNYKGFDRKTAVDNAISYLESIGITIKCTLYCESEKKLLARLVYHILEEILYVMFSFGKDYNEKKYIKDLEEIKNRYQREIISKGIISLIYSNVNWSDVESYKADEETDDCLLIDNGSDWRDFYDISYINTRIKLRIISDNDTDFSFHSGINYICYKGYDLQNKPVSISEEKFFYLDFFHLDYEYYIPNRFCYCTNIKSKSFDDECEYEQTDEDDVMSSFGKAHMSLVESKRGKDELYQARMYLKQKYCSDRKQQYMNSFSNIAEIISALLRINYIEFYSDDYNLSNTVLGIGFEQLTYFLEDNKISYSKKEISIIYRYLFSQWIDTLRHKLELYEIDEMFSLYSNKAEDKEYARSIDLNRITINRFKSLEILSIADDHYNSFCVRNHSLIDDFKSRIVYYAFESVDQNISIQTKIDYVPFKMLKEAIGDFQKRLDWNVPYYLRISVVEGENVHRLSDAFQGYGHVGDTKTIDLIRDDRYTVEGSDSIKLSFNDNIAEIKYILKDEYVQEQSDEIVLNNAENVNAEVILKKDHNYNIAFEALGISTAPFSVIIIRRAKNNIFEPVFEKNDIKLSPDFKSYSYEFTYNGESKERCYLAFGYGNKIGGYNIRHLHVSEIE